MDNSKEEKLKFFMNFLDVYAEDYMNSIHSLPDEFSLSDYPEIESAVIILSDQLNYTVAFLADALLAFQKMYPEEDLPRPLYNS